MDGHRLSHETGYLLLGLGFQLGRVRIADPVLHVSFDRGRLAAAEIQIKARWNGQRQLWDVAADQLSFELGLGGVAGVNIQVWAPFQCRQQLGLPCIVDEHDGQIARVLELGQDLVDHHDKERRDQDAERGLALDRVEQVLGCDGQDDTQVFPPVFRSCIRFHLTFLTLPCNRPWG